MFTLEEGNHRKVLETFRVASGRRCSRGLPGLYDPNGSTTHPGFHAGVIEGSSTTGSLTRLCGTSWLCWQTSCGGQKQESCPGVLHPPREV